MLVCADSGTELSVIVPYEESVQIAHDKIQAVLDGKSSDTVEDTFDANESAGTLSKEDIEAQINADLYGTYDSGVQYYNSNTYVVPQYDQSTYDQNAYYQDQNYYDPNANTGETNTGNTNIGDMEYSNR